MPRSLVSDGIV